MTHICFVLLTAIDNINTVSEIGLCLRLSTWLLVHTNRHISSLVKQENSLILMFSKFNNYTKVDLHIASSILHLFYANYQFMNSIWLSLFSGFPAVRQSVYVSFVHITSVCTYRKLQGSLDQINVATSKL